MMTKGEMTRQRIIEAAAPLFNKKGFEGCSIQDVVEATGIAKSGLYKHFESKEELAAASYQFAWGQVSKVRIQGIEKVDGSVQKLRYAVRRFVETPGIFPGGCPLLNTAIDTDDGNPVLRKLALASKTKWKDWLCGIVRDGVTRGEIRVGVEPRLVANTIIATLEGTLMISRLEGNVATMRDAQTALEWMLNGIAAS
jgi:TetR/AcrR family transcriptional repressor of nem operon